MLAVERTTWLHVWLGLHTFTWVLGETKQKISTVSWYTCSSLQWKVVLLEKLQSTVSCDRKAKVAEHCDLCLFLKGATTKNQAVLYHFSQFERKGSSQKARLSNAFIYLYLTLDCALQLSNEKIDSPLPGCVFRQLVTQASWIGTRQSI